MYTIEAEQVPSTLVKLVPSKRYDLYESLLFLCAQVAIEAEQILCKLYEGPLFLCIRLKQKKFVSVLYTNFDQSNAKTCMIIEITAEHV